MGNIEGRLVEGTSATSNTSTPSIFEFEGVKKNEQPYPGIPFAVDDAVKSMHSLGERIAVGTSEGVLIDLVNKKNPDLANQENTYNYKYFTRWANVWDDRYAEWPQAPMNGLIAAWHLAFAEHYPVSMSPDDVLGVIVNQIALHISQDPEKYAHIYSAKKGEKNMIRLFIPEVNFPPPMEETDWLNIVRDFAGEIKESIGGELFSASVADFTTTDHLREFVSLVGLMDTTQHYFNYHIATYCGVTALHLEGTSDDWVRLKSKVLTLVKKFDDLGEWVTRLEQVLDKFIETCEGTFDEKWWKSFYHYQNESGGPQVNGHIVELFCYVKDTQGNLVKAKQRVTGGWGCSPMSFPTALARVPVVWETQDSLFNLSLVAGSPGCSQNPDTLAVSPYLMWGVYQD